MNELESFISAGQLCYIKAKIDLNNPYETLELALPGYRTEKFDIFHSFHALASIFKFEIPFVISDLLHLIKQPIFYRVNPS